MRLDDDETGPLCVPLHSQFSRQLEKLDEEPRSTLKHLFAACRFVRTGRHGIFFHVAAKQSDQRLPDTVVLEALLRQPQ